MASQLFSPKISSSSKPIISLILCFLFMVIGVCPVRSARPDPGNSNRSSQAFRPGEESEKMKMMRAHLAKLNKPFVKSVQSSDGDIIDCVESDKQPAFDHPMLKGQKPLEPPERPKRRRHHPTTAAGYEEEDFQVWRSSSGESCPEGTIPIRRTLERDLLRASSIHHFGRKTVQRDSTAGDGAGHEHAIGYASGEEYYGAKASMSVWAPRVAKPYEFSLSQVWLISGAFGDDLNTIEAGWQVSPDLYGDNYPRFFTYWTSDAYQGTGCYNLLCSGFVQTNNKIAIGAAISPISSYKAGQYDISILIWKAVMACMISDKVTVEGSDEAAMRSRMRAPVDTRCIESSWLEKHCPGISLGSAAKRRRKEEGLGFWEMREN
ncbi:unnamed protein product [Cuscuta campestris]|uniref:Neprosin PEP catalytic domain-containing protein n=1 Tax=Cuscuta campestris TaxID=132261 RepID=A0A484MNE3_9ASTE|nr:unnamed protein product [Cuscuta campestris]